MSRLFLSRLFLSREIEDGNGPDRSSSYSAAFETHQSLRYLDECLSLAGDHWPAAAVSCATWPAA
jgi:hypothetical protein